MALTSCVIGRLEHQQNLMYDHRPTRDCWAPFKNHVTYFLPYAYHVTCRLQNSHMNLVKHKHLQ